jgi:hypothetical protein
MVLVVVPASLVVAVIAVASASAAVCHERGSEGFVALCIEKAKVSGVAVPFTGEKKTQYHAVPFNVAGYADVECGSAKTSGDFNTSGMSLTVEKLKIEFSECKVPAQEANCEARPVVAEATGAFVGAETGKIKLKGAKKGETFEEVEVRSRVGRTCTLTLNKVKIIGKLTCLLPHSEEELATHEMECPQGNSELEWSGKRDAFELTELLRLESNKLWGLMVS